MTVPSGAVKKTVFVVENDLWFHFRMPGLKMTICIKNDNSGQKWQFGSKMTILIKNDNSSQKLLFWSKMTELLNDLINEKNIG